MYEELVNALRETDFSDGCPCVSSEMCKNKDCIILQAADAIEELQKRVPKRPHGRLIDADALTISTAVPLDGRPYQYVHIDNIKDAPTVIETEEGE